MFKSCFARWVFILVLGVVCTSPVIASKNCFIAKENEQVLASEGDCKTPHAPESTFKIALSLMGFDSKILKDKKHPVWTLPDGIDPYINICKSSHHPQSWMRDSCLWYSQILTTKLGFQKFSNYVQKFGYGNTDVSGGLLYAWISSTLKISPEEQVAFIQRMNAHQLSVSPSSYQKTKQLMFIQEMVGGWQLYGKTGNGKQIDHEAKKTDKQHGWFVGYIEKDKRQITFAVHLVDDKANERSFASHRARNEALIKLWHLINNLEKD